MSRPTLFVCTSCDNDDARGRGEALFKAVKRGRKARGLKGLFRLEEARCLEGCDTPCNARLEGRGRPTHDAPWLDAIADVEPLLDAAARYAQGKPPRMPGRAG